MYAVILCGGAGLRLWPESRPSRPKPFLRLTGDLSLFQETVLRVAPLAPGPRACLVVAGRDQQAVIHAQLAALGVEATLLIEPEGRDSAAAIAAALTWIARRSPRALAVIVAADHHIPDAAAFRQAVGEAVPEARRGRIVTFGVRPTEASAAYGYIAALRPGLSPVARFVEKPSRRRARAYLARGWLWNSGNLLARADVLLAEVETHAPAVARAVRAAVPDHDGAPVALTDAFLAAPRLPIDTAVMEKSDRVSVLPVEFAWSDLGAWDAVAATGAGASGRLIGEVSGCLVRAAQGMVVVASGVSNLVIVAQPDAVLVCGLDQAQALKTLVENVRMDPSGSAGEAPAATTGSFADGARRFFAWMDLAALPLWSTVGVDADGGFVEALERGGGRRRAFRRARVQTRQIYVYSTAGAYGWPGPWRPLVERALDRFEQTSLRSDGLYRTRVADDGRVLDDTPHLYDQAFTLLAFAAAAAAGVAPEAMAARAGRLRAALDQMAHPAGGWREAGDHPFQANAHMHLLEACLAWEGLDPDGGWDTMADAVVALARRAFIDPGGGFLREFFDAEWRPAAGEDGRLVEPGHQFEWAWLLIRWGRARGADWTGPAALRLFEAGQRGVDPRRGVAFDELDDVLAVRSDRARLWPQTERLKAALILAEEAAPGDRPGWLEQARRALQGLTAYLEPNGLWRDRMEPDGGFADEPAPASSLYHIMAAREQAHATLTRLAAPAGPAS